MLELSNILNPGNEIACIEFIRISTVINLSLSLCPQVRQMGI